MAARPEHGQPDPDPLARRYRLAQQPAASSTVNGAEACSTSDASPVGIPMSMATNRNTNCTVPKPSP